MGFVPVKVLSPTAPGSPSVMDGRIRREINMQQVGLVRAIRASNPFVKPAVEGIAKSLLSAGIRITKSNGKSSKGGAPKEQLDADIQDLIDLEWSTFCHHVMQDIITFGWCIIALDTTRKVPMVRDPLDSYSKIAISSTIHGMDRVYELTMRELKTNGGGNSMGPTTDQSPHLTAPPMFVLEVKPPEVNGDLTSPMRTMIPLDAFMQTVLQCQITVNLRNARPLLITSTEHQNVESKTIARDMGAVGHSTLVHRDHDALAHRIHFEASKKTNESLRRANEQFQQRDIDANKARIAAQNNGQGWMQVMHVWPYVASTAMNNAPLIVNPVTGTAEYPALVGARQFEGSMIPLPPNTNLESTPEAKGAESFIIQMLEVFRDTVLMNLGVPPTLWGSTSSSVAGNLVVINTYNDTKNSYRVMLQGLIKYCFLFFWGANEIQVQAESFERQRQKNTEADTKKRVNEMISKSTINNSNNGNKHELQGMHDRIEVSLPGTLDLETIRGVNEMGLFKFETLRKYTSAFLGIPEEDLADEPMDPMSGRPAKEVQEESEQREEDVMKTQAKLQMSVKAPPKKGVGKQPAQKKPKTVGSR